jgi:hypothetical protein
MCPYVYTRTRFVTYLDENFAVAWLWYRLLV